MSNSRQRSGLPGSEPWVRSYSVTHPNGLHLDERAYDAWGRLILAERGAATLRSPGNVRVIPRHRAAWVPAGMPVAVRVDERLTLRIVYVRADRFASRLPPDGCEVNVRPLLRELIREVCRKSTLGPLDLQECRLAEVLVDEIAAVHGSPLELPLPTDPRARAAADYVVQAEPRARSVRLAELTEIAGASLRTLERRFAEETGMRLGEWVRRWRLMVAIRLLAGGASVEETAHLVGYRSTSAFVAAFRRELAVTPGQVAADARE